MRRSSIAVLLTSAAGAALCLYALHVQRTSRTNASYSPLCDFSPSFSCSDALRSPMFNVLSYSGLTKKGSFFDISNATIGLLVHMFMATYPLGRQRFRHVYVGVSVASLIFFSLMAYLHDSAYKSVCLVCMALLMANMATTTAVLVGRTRKERIRPSFGEQKRKRG